MFALGIHEDTGSLTYPGVTRRDADALAWCLRHGAQQEVVARLTSTRLSGRVERTLLDACPGSLETIEAGGFEILLAAVSWPMYVDGISNLAHKLVDLTDCRAPVLLVEMDGRVFCVVRALWPSSTPPPWPGSLGAGAIRRRLRRSTGARSRMHAPPP